MMKYEDYGYCKDEWIAPTFAAWLEAAASFGERRAIYFREGGATDFTIWTYARFAAEARRFGRALAAAGLKKGDRVALWSDNRPEWMCVWAATTAAGCVIVPVDFLVSEAECENILAITEARVFCYSESKRGFTEHLHSLQSVGKNSNIAAFVELNGDDATPPCAVKFRDFGATLGEDAGMVAAPDEIAPLDPASIVFTSGTTGFAKGVVLSHRGILANVSAAIDILDPLQTDTFISVLPLHHTYPTTCSFFAPLSLGIPTIIVEKLVGKVVIDDIHDAGGTFLIAVPLLYDKVMAGIRDKLDKLPAPVRAILNFLRAIALSEARKGRPEFGQAALRFIRKKAGLESIRMCIAGGGALNIKTADFFDSLGFNILQGYGMSENSPLISVNAPRHRNNASVGLPVRYTDVKIVETDNDTVELVTSGPQRTGEIVTRSPSLMLGYYKNPDATAEVFMKDADGSTWLKTGDLGYRDKDGFIFICGRKKNLIVGAGGKNIYPEEIETHFAGNRIIAEILVLAHKTEADEEIVALIYPNHAAVATDLHLADGVMPDETALHAAVKTALAKVNRTLPNYKKITGFKLVDKPFEKNAQQKIRRFFYKDAYGSTE